MSRDDTGGCDVDADNAMRWVLAYDEMRMLANANDEDAFVWLCLCRERRIEQICAENVTGWALL